MRGAPLGTQRRISSFHYGSGQPKAYVQASLHADELPGMLVAHHLRQRLAVLEGAGQLRGEVVVVPVANPIGLGQSVLRRHEGRFDLASGENFNRHYPHLLPLVLPRVEGRLGDDPAANVTVVRAAMREALATLPATDEVAHQRQTLFGLACDADTVLDLHCDAEALAHLYTGTPLWPEVEPLARLLGSRAQLLALESGDHPFDEACSQTWWQLAAEFEGRHPIPLACLSVTVELRGEADISHEQAIADAEALIGYLTLRGHIAGPAPALPPLLEPATPLAGTDVVGSPASGIVVYRRALGDRVRTGEVIADVVDPLSGEVHPLSSRADGLLFARESQRYTHAGRSLCKVAGSVAIRSGKLSTQ